ncbi:MAG: DMT family transporter, partial [Pseudomonadota bacterium]
RYSLLSAALVGFFWAMFEALRLTSTLNTAAIFSLIPGMTAVLSFTFLRERLSGAALVALLVGLVGAVWVIFRGSPSAFLSMDLGRGDLIFFAGSVSLAVYGTLVKVLHRGEPMARMTLWTLLTGTVWLLILATPRFGTVEWSAVPTTVYLGVAYLAVFTTIVTFFAVQWSTAVIGPTKVMAYSYLNPSLVLLIGLLLGTESPPMITYPGIALTVAATFVLQRSSSAR